MDIEWHGRNCIRLVSSQGVVVIDPYRSDAGRAVPTGAADIVAWSSTAPDGIDRDAWEAAFAVTGPGEYEIGGIFVLGVRAEALDAAGGLSTIYCVSAENLHVCHLGSVASVPSQAEIEALGPVDALIAPLGSDEALNASQMAEVVGLMEPSWVVPIDIAAGTDSAAIGRFLKEMGVEESTPSESLRLLPNRLPEEPTVQILTPRTDG
jgi:L-ascorbate metabolism protein UlaG (beta-lactamase superfamily)